jgi:hydrogenase nickel incorporation protein HypA/HybF
MHELGIAQEMLRIALEYAAKNKSARIAQFNVEISAAADESEDALRFHLEHLTRGTIAEGARFEIVRTPAQMQCLDCANEFVWTPDDVVCPRCASPRVRALTQDEFRLTSIDVET